MSGYHTSQYGSLPYMHNTNTKQTKNTNTQYHIITVPVDPNSPFTPDRMDRSQLPV